MKMYDWLRNLDLFGSEPKLLRFGDGTSPPLYKTGCGGFCTILLAAASVWCVYLNVMEIESKDWQQSKTWIDLLSNTGGFVFALYIIL